MTLQFLQGIIQYVDPTKDAHFPGLHEQKMELKDWKWTYGKTPKFTISEQFTGTVLGNNLEVQVKLQIEKGKLITIELSPTHGNKLDLVLQTIENALQNVTFCAEELDTAFEKLYEEIQGKEDRATMSWLWQNFEDLFK